MANLSFTRDEAILALDVLFSSNGGHVSATSDEIEDLSRLLNRLPIHPTEKRNADFRNPSGVTRQLNLFRSSCRTGKRSVNVGKTFFQVYFEFEDHLEELHKIAMAIRRNEIGFSGLFGCLEETQDFPEGALLGHLYRIIEIRDGSKMAFKENCEICRSMPQLYYQSCGQLLQQHLLVPPTELDYTQKYGAESFITVCPNCHEALHRYRPWLKKENCEDILR